MAVLRFLAGLCLMAAVIALVNDLTPMLSGSRPFNPTSLGELWSETAPKSLAAARTTISNVLSPAAWNSASGLLALPIFLLFGLLGILFGYLGRHRKRIEIFTN